MTRTPTEGIAIIERFLSRTSLYPQEWNDFVECRISNPTLDAFRDRREGLGSKFEPGNSVNDFIHQPEREAVACEELRNIVTELRKLADPSAKPD